MPLPETPFLDRIVAKDIAFRENPPSINELAIRFQNAARSSGGFTWMGVIEDQDEYEGSTVTVYLSERDEMGVPDQVQEAVADTVELFDDLALALEPQLNASLHLIRISECSTRQLQQKLQELCMSNPKLSIIYEEAFILSQPV